MRKAAIYMHGILAGYLEEIEFQKYYRFFYHPDYKGPAVSLTLPLQTEPYDFESFPPFFEGLLPEGVQLEGLLRLAKLDRSDYFGQLMHVGKDLVGAVTVEEVL
jgi:serine/threonine-protein kinase HipA